MQDFKLKEVSEKVKKLTFEVSFSAKENRSTNTGTAIQNWYEKNRVSVRPRQICFLSPVC